MASVPNCDTAEEYYSIQYFDFTPQVFFEDFSEFIIDELSLMARQMCHTIVSSEQYQMNTDVYLERCNKFYKLCCEYATLALADLKPTIDVLFTIPRNVNLNDDKEFTEEEVKNLQKEVTDLEKNYSELLQKINVTKAKLDMNDVMSVFHKKIEEQMPLLLKFKDIVHDIKNQHCESIDQDSKNTCVKKCFGDNEEDAEKILIVKRRMALYKPLFKIKSNN